MNIHLIGVGGISMRSLALYYETLGHSVSGCDLHAIELLGVHTVAGHDPSHVTDADLVVYTSAVTEQSAAWPEISEADKRGIRSVKRAEAIGEITRERATITVSGMHGKSTTSGMVAHILKKVGRDPLVMVGATLPILDNQTFVLGTGPFVLEADEFDRSFLSFTPTTAVITNIEAEHLDYYTGGLPEIMDTFRAFLARIRPGGRVIGFSDLDTVREVLGELRPEQVITYGRDDRATYQICNDQSRAGRTIFSVRGPDHQIHEIHLRVPGSHNQENAVGALLACLEFGVPLSEGIAALSDFTGVGQRFEVISERAGVTYIADYAHHPTEVAATVRAARSWYPDRRIVVVFQPHQYSRTKLLFDDFVRALGGADLALVTDIFAVPGRDEERAVTAAQLVDALAARGKGKAYYIPVSDLPVQLESHARAGDVILLMGAGRDITRLVNEYRKSGNS